mmetsp:Transcript_12482/g.27584  ORF Transcript_12482/g.27584 Transcript_12482/m.27584 type:complete len:668 (+) Transcript_12482:68-2071(+)|eukprot:CAMPEP_0204252660 /NCGR_PEP_ID=MMETSP0468-20130131/1343_1 /ASSEMBLY_ACC=CAM_ASM_000383 /TAXON_ID=2969 /ORGANISM="Oxyrrhis marina" /LENGTH=667 /DNA_ID=CAMNT_0051226123 /DNA_START=68 /DNA_END=2071 /DNA_ORIENTATION=+
MRCYITLALTTAALEGSPTGKVIQLLSSLQAKITAEGEREQKQFEQYVQWCEDNAKEKQHELKNSAESQDSLEAVVEKANSDIATTESRIDDLSASISQNEADLDEAKAVRKREHGEFVARDREMAETQDMLERAIQVFKKQMAGLVQVNQASVKQLVSTVTVLMEAPLVAGSSKSTLQAFVQQQEDAKDGEELEETGDSSGGLQAVLDTLEDLLEKAEAQRSKSTKDETEARFHFDMLKQSLDDELKTENKEISGARKALASYKETLASATKDLEENKKDASSDQDTLSHLQLDCMQTASDHEASVQGRAEELKALSEAKRVISEMTGGASTKAYGLVQMQSATKAGSINQVVSSLRSVGKSTGDVAVSLLASEINSAAMTGTTDDVFAKVKGLIRDMLERISEKAKADAKEHEWCTKTTAETQAKQDDHESEIAALTSKADKAKSAIAKANQRIATLEAELGELSRMQADMDKARTEAHANYLESKQDYEAGIDGVQMAIKVLKDYYGKGNALLQQPIVGTHSASGGAGSGIIGLLEVCESDFSKLLAEVEADESEEEKAYEKQTKENKLARTEKETSVKYTHKEVARAEKALAEFSDDLESEQAELDAVVEYMAKVNKRCVAKPETYADRKAKREAEIEGLKNALQILDEQTASSFLAIRSTRH